MSNYWIKDSKGGVVGPVSLAVVRDIARQVGLTAQTQMSRDGLNWARADQLPELSVSPAQRGTEEAQEAQRISMELDRFSELPRHALFGVPRGSSGKVFRQAFLALARPYYPQRLAQDVHPELLRACIAMYQFLSTQLLLAEQEASGGSVAALQLSPEQVVAAAPAMPIFELVRPEKGRPRADIWVNRSSFNIFTDHRLVNLNSGGLYLKSDNPLPLGTRLDLRLAFDSPNKVIDAGGTVILVSANDDKRQTRGMGLRMERVRGPEKTFITEYVGRARQANHG